MTCPFLKEGRALYCHAAPFGKMILEGPGYSDQGRCESPEYYRCELVKSDEMLEQGKVHRCNHLVRRHARFMAKTSISCLPNIV